MESLIDICGLVGSIGLVLGYLPQAIQTIRTRNTFPPVLRRKNEMICHFFLFGFGGKREFDYLCGVNYYYNETIQV